MEEKKPVEWDTSSTFNKWTFSIINKTLDLGQKRPLQFDDLMPISQNDSSGKLLKSLKLNYRNSRAVWFIPRLMVALFKTTGYNCILIASLTMTESAIKISLPVILRFLLQSLENGDSVGRSYMWASILGGLGIIQTITHHVLFFYSMRAGWNWKNSCTALIHDRLFYLNGGSMQSSKTSTGMLVNLISNDVARFEEFSVYACFTWEAILEIIAILIILVFTLNVASAFAGVGCSILLMPAMIQVAKNFAKFRSQTAAATDQRVRYICELIDGIASVKSYAWETPFFYLIRKLRDTETKNIDKSQSLRAVNQGIMFSTATVASFATFAVYWGIGGQLTIPKVFSTLSLLSVLRMTVGASWVRSIERGSESVASCLRIEAFLSMVDDAEMAEEDHRRNAKASKAAQYQPVAQSDSSAVSVDGIELLPVVPSADVEDVTPLVSISRSSYFYGSDPASPSLRDIEFSVSRGEILMVVGPVGCGKSSLLAAVLGEIAVVPDKDSTAPGQSKRQLSRDTSLAYCSQRPWILASSVKSNIALAGNHKGHIQENFKRPTNIDLEQYTLAVESCLIVDDMSQWPAYDDTEVGERGISISGGQKARISLARAVYSDAELCILDDPLSAVDAHVGKALFTKCIQSALKNRNKGVILVTHQLQYLKYADKVLVLSKDGQQTFYGAYRDLITHEDVMSTLELTISAEDLSDSPVTTAEDKAAAVAAETVEDAHKETRYDPDFRAKQLRAAATEEGEAESGAEKKRRLIVETEEKAVGQMSLGVYWKYISSGGSVRGLAVISVIILSQGLSMITDYWLRWWASEEYWDQSNNNYVIIYGVLAFLCAMFGYLRAKWWFQFTLVAASNLHESCLWAVMHSPLRFFISNPTGRILNRFAKDQNLSDEALPVTFFDFLQCSLFCLSAVVLICITIPWLILLIPFLVLAFYYLRKRYITSSREIKRIEAVTRSPIYADFSATLDGLVTLRAYKLEERVAHLFQQQIDDNGKAWFSFLLVSRWLGFRLDLESAFLVLIVSMFAVILRDTVDVGLIGFTLVYTVSLSGMFQWTVRQSAEVETQMTSVERISAYATLPQEEGYTSTLREVQHQLALRTTGSSKGDHKPGSVEVDAHSKEIMSSTRKLNERAQGHLELRNLSVKYRDDLDHVLKRICVDIPAGSKVGICGRTGSGKSSTLLALLRLNIITEGDIVLDGASLLSMDLETARSLISIIPQEPHLFSGTVRFNLDPFSIYSDEQIWAALRDAHIFEYISKDPFGLSSAVAEGGKNFSVGQRQLLSLARAILRKCKVVLMDEVTASIDFLTDRLIQETIRTSPVLKDATIITVAHRLRTIADSDLIVVIYAGEVVEKGHPKDLLLQPQSHFRKLAEESNEFDEIVKFANKEV